MLPGSASAFDPALKRYPYLTDVVGSSGRVNFGTDRSSTTAVVKWGVAGGSCTTNTATATRTSITVNSVPQYQWSARLSPLTPNTQYCYRVYLGSSPQLDLLGTDPSPQFFSQIPSGSTQSFSFAVFGDWGEMLSPSGINDDQANVMQQIAASGVRFAVTTGDQAYPSGSQTHYGDLAQLGTNVSALFGPSIWKVPGAKIPLFPTIGNHGHTNGAVHLLNWPQGDAVSSSGGRYVEDTYCCLNGTMSHSYASPWYAFDVGNSRFYILKSAWSDSNLGTADLYKNDYDNHWTPGSPQYQWLQNDLATHSRQHKFAFFHFPIYSDSSSQSNDTYHQSAQPPAPPSNLEGLLSSYGVDVAFSGHAHIYQRNIKRHANSLPTYVTGGGGADIGSISTSNCSSWDAYGIGWSDSNNRGNACGNAPTPTSRTQVYHFLKVTVNGGQVTVTPTDSLGRTFDIQTYGGTGPTTDLSITKADSPDPVLAGGTLTYTLTARNNGPSTATGVNVVDTLPGSVSYQSATSSQGSCSRNGSNVSCALGSLASGASATVTIRVTPQSSGSVTNTASISGAEQDTVSANNSASATTTVNPSTDLSITKTDSPDPALVGGTLTYTLTARNNGPSSATGVNVSDTLPASLSYQSATPSQGTCSQSAGTVSCALGSLANGASATVTINATPQSTGSVTNTASISGGQTDTVSTNNSASATTTVNPATDLSITKTDSPDPVLVGGTLTYTLTARNNGPSAATGVTISDTLPVSLSYQSATPSQGTCSQNAGTVSCALGSLANGASATVTIRGTPQAPGVLTNTASVSGAQTDTVSANNSASATTTVNPSTDLSLTKTDSPDPVLVGGTLTYTLTARNNGPSSATGVNVSDTLPASLSYQSATPSQGTCSQNAGTVSCALGSLANGASATVTIRGTPQSPGVLTNTASVSGAETDTSSANNSASATTTANPSTDLSLTKADSPDPVLVGGTLTYTLTARNNGPSSATGVSVTDTLPASLSYQSATPSQGSCSQSAGTVSCALGSLANGATATITITVTPQSSGPVTNTASISGAEQDTVSGNNSASTSTTVNPSTDLAITKTDAPDPVLVGGTLTYTLTARNNGPSPATGVSVSDTLPVSLSYQSATPSQGTCSQSGGTVSCALGSLANGASATVTIQATPQATGPITNTASVSGAQTDTVSANNSASATTTVNPSTDLSITKADSPDPVLVGGTLTYTLTARNNGPSPATGVSVSDTLPVSLSYQSATPSQGTCSQSGGTVSCALGSLANGASATVTIQATPQASGPVANTASVSGAETDTSSANNSASATTTVNPSTDLSMTKADSPDPVLAGQTLTYTLTARNNGPSAATGVTVSDTLPGGVTYVSATPSQGNCSENAGSVSCALGSLANGASATVEIRVTPEGAGALTNTATVSGAETDTATGNNSASEGTTVNPAADLSITKTDSPDPVLVGGTLTYTLTARNDGPSTATGASVVDTLPASLSYQSATPSQGSCSEVGGSVSCALGSLADGASATVTIQTTAQAEGGVVNSASVQASEADPAASNNSASEGTTVVAAADLSITKTDSPDPVAAGDALTYTLTARNNGPSGATGVTLSDTLPAGVTYVSAVPSQGTCSETSGTVSCALGALANGASASAEITVRPQDGGTITNSANVQANEADPSTSNNAASEVTTVNPAADLSLTKTDSPDPVLAGQTLTYTITASNDGPSSATGTTLTDTLPSGVTYQSATPSQGSCEETAGTVTCALGTVGSGASASVQLEVRPQADGQITNSASVDATEPDPDSADNEASQTTTVAPAADLSLTKVDAPDPVLTGDTLLYTLTVRNDGPQAAGAATLTDDLPANVVFESAQPSQGICLQLPLGSVTCELGDIASSGTATVELRVRPVAGGQITNSASVQGTAADPSTANNADTEGTTVNPADLSLTKSDSPDPVGSGQPLTYTLTARNNGPGATNATVTDDLPAGVTFGSAVPSQGSCAEAAGTVSCDLGPLASASTATIEIVVTPESSGNLTNTASVQGSDIDPDESNNDATESTIVDAADLSLTKADSPDPVLAGQPLTYTLTARNNGPSAAPSVTLTDDLPAGVTYESANPSQGSCTEATGTVSCDLGAMASDSAATVEIVVTPVGQGEITNTATVSAPNDPSGANNSASEATTVQPAADLSVTKADSPDPALVGQTLTYSLSARNDGPSAASNVVLTDDLPPGVRFDSATPSQGSCTEASGSVSCDLGALSNGGSATVELRVTPEVAGSLTNSVDISGSEGDPNGANDSDSEETAVNPAADLSITKTDAPDPVFVNESLTYSLQVSNSGPSGATGVSVTDPLPTAVAFVSASPSQGSCAEVDHTLTCDLGDLSSGGSATIDVRVTPNQGGTILNTASVQGSQADPSAGNDSDSEQTEVSLYDHPREASPVVVSLVPAHRQTISPTQCTARGGAPSTHGAPLAQDSCNPPSYLANTIAGLGSQSVGSAAFTVIPGDSGTPADEADLSLGANVTDVVNRQGGGDYNPSASGADITLVSKFRLTDTHNGPALADPATVADFDFPVGVECQPTADPAVGSSCSVGTTADAVIPGSVKEGDNTVVQLFRVRLSDSGLNGTRGDGDDRNFAIQGLYVP